VRVSEEHTDNLKKARARLIEQRRAFVKVLAGPYERSKTNTHSPPLASGAESEKAGTGSLRQPVRAYRASASWRSVVPALGARISIFSGAA
jgi:hypothetical protein